MHLIQCFNVFHVEQLSISDRLGDANTNNLQGVSITPLSQYALMRRNKQTNKTMGKFSLEVTFTDKNGLQTNAYELDFDTTGKLTTSQIVGTACNELYRWVDIIKDTGGSFKTTGGNFDLVMRNNSVTIDTAKAKRQLRTKFFFNKTDESRKRFARRVYALAKFMATNPTVVSVEQLEELMA